MTAVIAHEAVWELASESYVVVKAGKRYGRIYHKYPNLWGQLVFWLGMGGTAVFLTRRLTKKAF